jgi:hypothetical protein
MTHIRKKMCTALILVFSSQQLFSMELPELQMPEKRDPCLYTSNTHSDTSFDGSCEQCFTLYSCALLSASMFAYPHIRPYTPTNDFTETLDQFAQHDSYEAARWIPASVSTCIGLLAHRHLSCCNHSCLCGRCKKAIRKTFSAPNQPDHEKMT